MGKKLTFADALIDGFAIGVRNSLSIICALILWVLTIWIPYINVGTTIAICSIPIVLSKGEIISPLFIFRAKYRQYMGEFFTLIGLMLIALIPAYMFMIVPAIIIGTGWSLAIFIMLDKETTPTKALWLSNKATKGYKWIIFFVILFWQVLTLGFSNIVKGLGVVSILLSLPVVIMMTCAMLGSLTYFYQHLFLDAEEFQQDL